MPAKKFTARWVKSATTDKDREDYFDYSRFDKGQALVLRVRRSGTKSWCVSYIQAGKNKPPFTIGRYPQLSLADAADEGRRVLDELLNGTPPGKLRQQRNAQGAPEPITTFEATAELFLLRYCINKADKGTRDRSILEREFIPVWGAQEAETLRRADVIVLLDAIAERGPVAANRAHSCLRKLFNWAVQRDLLDTNPATNIARPGGKEKARDRVLTDDEIRSLWAAVAAANMAEQIKLLLQLMLVTAQRKAELLQAQWSEFDLTAGWWTIPAEHAKNRLSHRVPLSSLALQLLRQASALNPDSGLVLASPRSGDVMVGSAVDRAVRNNRDYFTIAHWTPHDLRRSAASKMAGLGVSRLVIKKLLNHADSDITAVYDRYSYDEEKKAALALWAQYLQQLVGGAV
jgi:integrase